MVHLHDMHAHIHRVRINLGYDVIPPLHLMCNLNDGKVILGLDWQKMGSLPLDLVLEHQHCQVHVALRQLIDSLMVLKCHHRLMDVTEVRHVYHYQKAFATNVMLRLIDLMMLMLMLWLYLNLYRYKFEKKKISNHE